MHIGNIVEQTEDRSQLPNNLIETYYFVVNPHYRVNDPLSSLRNKTKPMYEQYRIVLYLTQGKDGRCGLMPLRLPEKIPEDIKSPPPVPPGFQIDIDKEPRIPDKAPFRIEIIDGIIVIISDQEIVH